MPPDDLLERFEIDPAKRGLPPGGAPEPVLTSRPYLVEFDEIVPLDTARGGAEPEAAPRLARQSRLPRIGVILSLLAHLLPLLALIPWVWRPEEPPAPIPIQLVIEQPPPPPPPPPKPPDPKPPEPKRPPPSQLTSAETRSPSETPGPPAGPKEPTPPQAEEKPVEQKPATEKQAEKKPPREQSAEAKPQPPQPRPPRDLVSALPLPSPDPQPPLQPPDDPVEKELKAPLPAPAPPPTPAPKQRVAARAPPKPRVAPRSTGVPGPSATHDEYLAYCMSLIRRNSGILSRNILAGRRGLAILTVRVRDDGTIERISVLRSSGYDDIDAKIGQMVSAVRRFPPLPQWIQEHSVLLSLEWVFPDPMGQE